MRILTRFQNSYDKYLFEGIVNPEDYYGFIGTSDVWTGCVVNNSRKENSNDVLNENSIISLYVLNTLDHNFKVEPENPENIVTKFFSSMKKTSSVSEESSVKNLKNILLISIQPLNVLHNIIDYFISLEKEIRPDTDVTIYTISSLTLYNELEKNEHSQLKKLINSYGKHTFIDLSLAITAIEIFKRRKLINIYKKEFLNEVSETNSLKGIDINLINHHDKIVNTKYNHKLYIPKISKNTINLKNISEFLDKGTNGSLKSEECFEKRLTPLIPKFNYRIYDKLETFALNNISKSYNILIINTLNLSFKNLLYISILKWNLIFITLNTESNVEYVYENLSQIYNSKSFDISKNELRKLNPDYSLLRSKEELENEKHIFSNEDLIPHIMIDTLCGIKSYLKKLESSLEVDNIKICKLEI
jgi:hypothetical protein